MYSLVHLRRMGRTVRLQAENKLHKFDSGRTASCMSAICICSIVAWKNCSAFIAAWSLLI